jgi:hypothetical protein
MKFQRNRKVRYTFHDSTIGCLNQIDGIDGKGMRADQIVAVLSASDAGAEGLLRQTRRSGGGDLWGVRPVGVLAPLAAASAEAGDRSDEAVASNRDKIL